MRIARHIAIAVAVLLAAASAGADTLEFRDGRTLQGRLVGGDEQQIRFESDGVAAAYDRADVAHLSLGSDPAEAPAEPEDLDVPVAWREGDPEATETEVPETEPEQECDEAPPSQPLDDDRGEAPSPRHAWASGYWWWNGGIYVWVPGYWSIPPVPGHIYISGYWRYGTGRWAYVRGGWGLRGSATILVYPRPRPLLTVRVFPAPPRIVRRHHRWRHHHDRRIVHHRHRLARPHQLKHRARHRAVKHRREERHLRKSVSKQHRKRHAKRHRRKHRAGKAHRR